MEVMLKIPDIRYVRNVGIAGHIDHGKTTLTDHILAEGGVISKELAGKARYLDYWLEEQRRGITMKTTVMSFQISVGGSRYLIHLCDTPGHVDFSGKVSRAFRLVDSVLFVVDAVEGIMAQTESYLRLALREVTRPILCINKIDRLITELREDDVQIFARLSSIIKRFNEFIDRYSPNELKNKWKVNAKENTVIFCSALHGWGFTLKQALERGFKFRDLIDIYKNDYREVKRIFPLGSTLAEVIIQKCLNPIDSQKKRIKYLWEGEMEDSLIECSKDGNTIFYVSKAVYERGRIFVTARVFSGEVSVGEYFRLNNGSKRKLRGLFMLKASKIEAINSIPAGHIFGAFIDARPGDTYSKVPIKGRFKQPIYLAYPVLAVAIEPKEFAKYNKLQEIIKRICIEDPNIAVEVSKETGQILIYGIGELHLELVVKKIHEEVPVSCSKPMVAFRELVVDKVEETVGDVYILIEPRIDPSQEIINIVDNEVEIRGVPINKRMAIETIIRETMKNGPRIGEPVIGAKIHIDAKENVSEEEILKALSIVLTKLSTKIIQPYYKFSISVSTEHIGRVINELSARNAKIETLTRNEISELEGIIAVLRSIGLASRLRDVSQGKASAQLEFVGFKMVSRSEEEEVCKYIASRFRGYLTQSG